MWPSARAEIDLCVVLVASLPFINRLNTPYSWFILRRTKEQACSAYFKSYDKFKTNNASKIVLTIIPKLKTIYCLLEEKQIVLTDAFWRSLKF